MIRVRVLFALVLLLLANSGAYACNPFACFGFGCGSGSGSGGCQTVQRCQPIRQFSTCIPCSSSYPSGVTQSYPVYVQSASQQFPTATYSNYPTGQPGNIILTNCANGRCTPVTVQQVQQVQQLPVQLVPMPSIAPAVKAESLAIPPKPAPKLEPK